MLIPYQRVYELIPLKTDPWDVTHVSINVRDLIRCVISYSAPKHLPANNAEHQTWALRITVPRISEKFEWFWTLICRTAYFSTSHIQESSSIMSNLSPTQALFLSILLVWLTLKMYMTFSPRFSSMLRKRRTYKTVPVSGFIGPLCFSRLINH